MISFSAYLFDKKGFTEYFGYFFPSYAGGFIFYFYPAGPQDDRKYADTLIYRIWR